MKDSTDSTDATLFTRFAQAFQYYLKTHPGVVLELGPMESWVLMSTLHLAMRHPEFEGPNWEIASTIARRIESDIAPAGVLAEVAAQGRAQESVPARVQTPDAESTLSAAIALVFASQELQEHTNIAASYWQQELTIRAMHAIVQMSDQQLEAFMAKHFPSLYANQRQERN